MKTKQIVKGMKECKNTTGNYNVTPTAILKDIISS